MEQVFDQPQLGIAADQRRLEAIDAARLQRVFGTNVFGAFLCSREAVRRMSSRHGGSGGAIVNVSSGASRMGSPGEYIDYAATKGALDTLTLGLAREVATEGIRVNAVLAGHIYTELHASGGEPNRVERVKSQVPMGRGGRPALAGRQVAPVPRPCQHHEETARPARRGTRTSRKQAVLFSTLSHPVRRTPVMP